MEDGGQLAGEEPLGGDDAQEKWRRERLEEATLDWRREGGWKNGVK